MTASPTGTTVGQVDSPESVYLHPATPAVAALTGGTQLRTVEAVDSKVTLFGQSIALAQPMSGPMTLLIRPEQLEFIEDSQGPIVVSEIALSGTAEASGVNTKTSNRGPSPQQNQNWGPRIL